MNEWTVVTVVIALAGVIGVFVKAAWKLATALQSNTDATKNQTDVLNQLKSENKKDHDKFSDKLDDHETRIVLLEHADEN